MSHIKQVIVMRKDLKMRRGKEVSQGAHASMSFITRRLKLAPAGDLGRSGAKVLEATFSAQEQAWLEGTFTKVTVQVNSEQELLDVYQKAQNAGLVVHLITDSGFTEFNGVPTKTCLAIGPDESELIDAVTGNLSLY